MDTLTGDGDGYGYGYGDGDGYGAGDGDGDGAGHGAGDGDGEYLKALLDCTPRSQERAAKGCMIGFWRSSAAGQPANGGSSSKKAEVGLVEEIKGPLEICTPNALHATTEPWRWKGERLWVVAIYPPYIRQEDKIGGLKREILAEIYNFF